MTLDDWLTLRGHGSLSALYRTTGLGWVTLWRARRGRAVSYRTAVKISVATGGAVPVAHLCDPQGLVGAA
ncbi:hypothetical protein JYT86_00670 [bacterium AH-315-N03]|nr:hypothetical protein [bacterium AH-315-N03]